jgi:hypothetical protein
MSTIGTIVVAAIGGAAALSWLYTVFHWIRALGHRKPEIGLSTLLLNGMKSFDADNFTEAGQVHVRAMVRGFMVFFACIFAGIAFGVLMAAVEH